MFKQQLTKKDLGLVLALAGFMTVNQALVQTARAAGEVNVYSSRHYQADKDLYKLFQMETGIQVNVVQPSAYGA